MIQLKWLPLGMIICLMAKPIWAQSDVFALIIGNNAAPEGVSDLENLNFADDDAIRFTSFLHSLTDNIQLLTLPDSSSQKRYGNSISAAQPPTLENLEKAIKQLAHKIADSKTNGHQTSLFFVFSGHGAFTEGGEPYLSLLDGEITRRFLYENILGALPADYQHVFLDACYAGGVAFSKGVFSNETDTVHVELSTDQLTVLSGANYQKRFPGLGVFVSSNIANKTHEWSVLQSGIFTHEVLSGLSGAADINIDGKIEYSELEAFISSANRKVADERARVSVVAVPPPRNQRIPIVDLAKMKKISLLHGSPSKFGHFFIERHNGERYLDANLSAMPKMSLALPTGEDLYLYTNQLEATFRIDNSSMDIKDLSFTAQTVRQRGGVSNALSKGLFQGAYGKDYYLGFVENGHLPAVNFAIPESTTQLNDVQFPKPQLWRRPTSALLFSISGSALVTSGILGFSAAHAKTEFEQTDIYADSANWNQKFQQRGNASLIALAVSVVSGILATVVVPKKQFKRPIDQTRSSSVHQ